MNSVIMVYSLSAPPRLSASSSETSYAQKSSTILPRPLTTELNQFSIIEALLAKSAPSSMGVHVSVSCGVLSLTKIRLYIVFPFSFALGVLLSPVIPIPCLTGSIFSPRFTASLQSSIVISF